MAKKKQEVKLKEPVRIRFKQLANGNQSIYLDYYTGDVIRKENYVGGKRQYEFLKLYLIPEKTREDKANIPYFYSVSDFFWESGFYESLKLDEKRKYMSFNPLSFDYSRYEQDNTVYDEELPYFSVVVKAVVLERYSAYLRKKKENKVQAEMQPQQEREEPQPIQDKYQEPKIIPHIAKTENPFKSILNDRQIELLVECINEVEIFNAPMTFEDLKAILSCKPKVIFRSNNNRLVAFLFSELSNRGLITPNWQSVIAKNKLFVTKNIKNDKYLNQGDLATAANYVKGVEHEKDYVTISNYIKQLKKL